MSLAQVFEVSGLKGRKKGSGMMKKHRLLKMAEVLLVKV
jgi:hypothetical protein